MYTKTFFRHNTINAYALIIFIFLFSSSASTIAKSDVALAICTLYGSILNTYRTNDRNYLLTVAKIVLIYVVIIAVYYIKNGNIDLYTWIGLLFKIVLSYNAVFYCKVYFESYFIKTVYVLGIISLILYFIQLIDFQFLFNINDIFGLAINRNSEPNSNSLLFNLVPLHNSRNSGFMWEPGAFSAVLIIVLALAFKMNNQIDKVKIVIILCILTTFSTTGYIALFLILTYFFYEKVKVYALLFLIPIFMVFIKMDIITDKISNQFNNIQDDLSLTAYSEEYTVHLNRFASMYADYDTFTDNPMIGLGVDIYSVGKKEYYKDYDENVVRTSGIMFSLIKFGLVGFIIYLVMVYRHIKFRFSDNRFALFFCFILLIELISNPIDFSTLLLTFLFL